MGSFRTGRFVGRGARSAGQSQATAGRAYASAIWTVGVPGWPEQARLDPVTTPAEAGVVTLSGVVGHQNPDSCRASETTADEIA